MKTPTTGRIVHYILSETDCAAINEQRARRKSLGLIAPGESPGNPVVPGDIVPAIIVRVWSEQSGCMNGQALLDGPDSLWLMSRERDDSKRPHSWHWPEDVDAVRRIQEMNAELADEKAEHVEAVGEAHAEA